MLWCTNPSVVLETVCADEAGGFLTCRKCGYVARVQDALDFHTITVHGGDARPHNFMRSSSCEGKRPITQLTRASSRSFNVADMPKRTDNTPSLSECSSRATTQAATSPTRSRTPLTSTSPTPERGSSPVNVASHRDCVPSDDAESKAEAQVRAITMGMKEIANAARACIKGLPLGTWANSTWTERLRILQAETSAFKPSNADISTLSAGEGSGHEREICHDSGSSCMAAEQQASHAPLRLGRLSSGLEMCQYMDREIDISEMRGCNEKFDASFVSGFHEDVASSFSDESSDLPELDRKGAAVHVHRVVTDDSLADVLRQGITRDEIAILDRVMFNISTLEEEVRALRASLDDVSFAESFEEERSTIDTLMEGRHLADCGRDCAAGVGRFYGEAGSGSGSAALRRREKDLERREALLRRREEQLSTMEQRVESQQKRKDLRDYCDRLQYAADELSLQVIKRCL